MSRSKTGPFFMLFLAPLLVGLAGCGPTRSSALILDADVQLHAAKTADAENLSPYEYTLAEAYLKKAREEAGYSDWDISIDFANKALKYATEAKEKSMSAKSDGAVPGAKPADAAGPAVP